MRGLLIFCLFAMFYLFPYKDVVAFPMGGPFKICSLPGDGCLAPGEDDIITMSWHPATSPFGANVTWESVYAGNSGGSDYYFIINIHTGMCLDVVNGAYHDNAKLKVNPCSAVSTSQWWRVQNYGIRGSSDIRNLPSGKCITVFLMSGWTGDPPVQATCTGAGQGNQYWIYDQYP